MNEVRSDHAGNRRADALEQLQKRVAIRSALHARQHVAAGVLQRHVHVFRQARVRGDRVEQSLRDAIGIAVEEAHPVQAFDAAPAAPAAPPALAQVRDLRRRKSCPGRSA